MNNFFCGLHLLVGLADATAEALKNWEALINEDDSVTEAGTLRLIRISFRHFLSPNFKETVSTLFFTMQPECFTFEIILHGT